MSTATAVVVLAVVLSAADWSQARPTHWLVFVDDMHLSFLDTGRLRQVVGAINRELVRVGDRCTVRCSGPSCTVGKDAPTTCEDLADWRRAVGNGLKEEDQLVERAERRPRELIYRAEVAVTAADALLREASGTGPGILLYISDGYIAEADAADRLSALAVAAAAKGVRIVPVRFRRVEFDPNRTPTITPETWRSLITETLASLSVLADRTGGVVIDDPLEGGLKKVSALVP